MPRTNRSEDRVPGCARAWTRLSAWILAWACAAVAIPAAAGVAATAAAQVGEGASAPVPIVLPRHPALSPDGAEVAFSYQGDLWVVARAGGVARRLTAHPAYEGQPRWSPDGRWIAFASDREGNDDIYVLPIGGGEVRRLTWNSMADAPSGWTPDSRAVLFRSWRYTTDGDNPGIFLVPLEGGTPATAIPAGGHAPALSPDGGRIACSRGSVDWTRRGYAGNARHRLWIASFEPPLLAGSGGGVSPGFPGVPPGEEAERGAQRFRAGEDSQASCAQLALQAAAALRPTASCRGLGVYGRDAAWFPGGEHLLFLREVEGVGNLAILRLADGRVTPLTDLREGRLRLPSLSADGRFAAAEYEAGIVTVEIPPAWLEEEPPRETAEIRRLEILVPFDPKTDAEEWVRVNGGADECALSRDGKQIALVARGEVFVIKTQSDEPAAYDVSLSQARDCDVAWLPDSSGLLFASDRDGDFDLYRVASADPTEPRLARALRHELTRLTDDDAEDRAPCVSPDGARIAFLRGGRALWVMDAGGGQARRLAEGMIAEDFAWSPDGRWLAFSREDDDFNSDIWIVSADGKTGPVNLSQHPDADAGPAWSGDGKLLAFTSRREFFNQTDIWYVWLTLAEEERSSEARLDALSGDSLEDCGERPPRGEAESSDERGAAGDEGKGSDEAKGGDETGQGDEKKAEAVPEVVIDFDGIHDRLHRLTSFPGEESSVLVTKNAKEFVFVADTDGKRDLWKIRWDGSEPKRLTQGGQAPSQIQWDEKGKRIFYLKSGGAIASVSLDGGDAKSYGFETELRVDRRAQRGFVFDEGWRALRDNFYDEGFHGRDWQALHDHYRPWALGASTYRDFQDVVRLMMGELNASHLGTWGGPGDPDGRGGALAAETGELGVLWDADDEGPGLRIAHVVAGTPADRVESRLTVGDRLLAVNGTALRRGDDLARLLERTVDRRTRLEIAPAGGGESREVVIRPIAPRALRDRLYEEEIALRQACVAAASGGRVAYIHVRSMDEGSLDRFERDLYAQAHGKEALIIDVRNNPGGWTTDLLLTSLTAPDHAVTTPRAGGPGYPEGRRLVYAWTRPIVLLCDENSFSNAEIFSWAIRTIGRGPVIGQQTFGGVISTGGTTLLDGSYIRLPFRGWRSRLDGSNQENTGCMPDIVVENLPDDLVRGHDAQLERAVAEALRQLSGR